MCLYVDKKKKRPKANKCTVYKVMKVNWSGDLVSWYEQYPYKLGVNRPQGRKPRNQSIHETGCLHVYVNRKDAEKTARVRGGIVVAFTAYSRYWIGSGYMSWYNPAAQRTYTQLTLEKEEHERVMKKVDEVLKARAKVSCKLIPMPIA